MTLNELKNDVARLGFENYIEDENCFVASANRALSLIYIDRPVSKSATISIRGPRINIKQEFIEHHAGEVIEIPFSGKSISFRTTGKGLCVITDQTGSNRVPLSMNNQLTKQFVFGNGSIVFSGDFYFTVSNLAVFEDTISNNTPDIPEFSPVRVVDPNDWCNDFRSFYTEPCDKYGNPIDSIKLIDGRIHAPYEFAGEIFLTYYRLPTPITSDDTISPIDISNECAPLLPLLTASFMWLDDDVQKAQYYMSLYRDLVANVKRYSTNKIDAKYSVNGWA
jgi:hypothetical protein